MAITKTEKQRLLLEYLVSSPDTFTLCKPIIKADYFDPEYRKTVGFIHEYYDEYHAIPSPDQIFAESSVHLDLHHLTKDKTEYCANEIEKFCKRRAFEQALVAAPGLMGDDEDYGNAYRMIKEALAVSLNKSMGIEYFDDPRARLEQLANEPARTPTKWHSVDELLGGGLARTELLLVSANSGGGKSITLANLAVNFLAQKLNVLYLSLELSEQMITQRFDTMFTGVSTVVWRQHIDDMAMSLETISPHMGKLVVKHMPSGTNSNAIRAYLKEFELMYGYVPDLLVVDYLDCMGANEHVSADNISEKDKRASEQLHDIGFEYNMFLASASQQNRSAIEAPELNQGHIAGGLTKVNTCDVYISIVMTPTMRAAGEIGFVFLKTRSSDGVGKTVYLKWDSTHLRIMNPLKDETIDDDGVIQERGAVLRGSKTKAKSLGDLLGI
jgi:KaiC/GvpD/RAD55 family RecA-like ATPase